MDQIPYIVYEAAEAKAERTQKRLIIALMVAVVVIFLTNAFWLYEWTRYDYAGTETEISQDGEGINNIGRMGDVNHGTKNQGTNESEEETGW